MTEFSSVSGLRGVRELIERWRKSVTSSYVCADELESVLAALSLPPSPQSARNQDYKSDLHADLRDFDQAVAYVRACAIEGALDIALRDVLEAHGVAAPVGAQGQVQGVQPTEAEKALCEAALVWFLTPEVLDDFEALQDTESASAPAEFMLLCEIAKDVLKERVAKDGVR